MGSIYSVGFDEAIIISGGCCGGRSNITYQIGGWAWAWWYVSDVRSISLEVMTLNPNCKEVETAEGVPLTVTGVAQVKIISNPDILKLASEQFLGKKPQEIRDTILKTLEGHLRAILGMENSDMH